MDQSPKSSFQNFYERRYTKDDIVRTDFILENVFAHVLENYYSFNAISAMNEKEKNVLDHMKELLNAFNESYANAIKNLCCGINISHEDEIGNVLLGVSNGLFLEGITWSRIIALFIFVGQITSLNKLSGRTVDVMFECFSRLVKEKLEAWIDDKDGWEGITRLVKRQELPDDSKKTGIIRLIKTRIARLVKRKEDL